MRILRSARTVFLLFVFGLSVSPLWLRAEEEKQATTKTIKGLQFKLPEDWPIEDRGGAVGPIPVEEYLTLRFGKVDNKFIELEARTRTLQEKLGTLTGRVQTLEELLAKINNKLSDVADRLRS